MTAIATDGAGIGEGDAPGVRLLISELARMGRPRIVEVGTLRWEEDRPTHHTAWAPHGDWLRVDRVTGLDVDLADDAHTLREVGRLMRGVQEFDGVPLSGGGLADAYVSCSVWEHLERPWLAMSAAAAVVRPGGLVYVQTHQTFPIHGYPSDFYRFSDRALAVQAEDAGLDVVHAGYLYPCRIEPPAEVTRWNRSPDVEAWLNVELLARRR